MRIRGAGVRSGPGADRELRRRVASARSRRRDLRRARPPGERHRRHAWDLRGARAEHGAPRRVPRVHVLHGRARPPPGFPCAERPHARVREALGGQADPVRPPRPDGEPDRGGGALPRPRRARDQAPSARPALHAERRAAGASVRARLGAARPDPDPRWPRTAAHLGSPRAPRRQLSGRAADHRPRRNRRPGRAGRALRRQGGRLLRHVRLEPGRPAQLLPPGRAGAGAVRVRLPVRASAELAPERGPHSARRRLRRRPAARPARGHRKPHRERRGPAAADRSRWATAPSGSR